MLSQCKEQSDSMLEKACITVENTAKGGGVYPEVLFQVAKYWYELYLRVSASKYKSRCYIKEELTDSIVICIFSTPLVENNKTICHTTLYNWISMECSWWNLVLQ